MKAVLICIALFLASLVVNNCLAQQSDTIEDSLLQQVPAWMAEYHVPCVGVGLIEQGRVKWVKVFGQLRQGVPAPANTLFNIASQTKPVVAMLTLKLVQSGSWDLDEPLAHYWIDPDVNGDTNLVKLTTRIVLSHQTGFPNWRTDNGGNKLSFNFTPGTKFGYSGEGFEYLRRALESKFHQPLNQLLDSLLFKPLGMKDTRYWGEDLDTSRFARWHNGQGQLYTSSIQTPVSAADDLITTVEDYCRLGILAMNGDGLSPALYNDMVKPQVQTKEHYFRGLGWGLIKDLPDGDYALEHGGSDIGVRTMAIFMPGSKSGIVVMTNGDNGMFVYDRIIKQALPAGAEILAIMNKGRQSHERITLPDSILQRYTGTYKQNNGKVIQIAQEGNAIRVSGDGAPTAVLFPETANKFFLPDYDVQLEFTEDDALIIYESGKKVMKIDKVH